VYARDKRRVEEMLLERGRALVVRTAWLFGPELAQKNFAYTVIRGARGATPLSLPVGQSGCPTFSGWLAESTLQLLAQTMEGVVHLTGAELLTKADWARLLVSALRLPPCEIREVSWDAAGQVAPRPKSVRLRSTRHRLEHPQLRSVLTRLREPLSLASTATMS
jgi:dTDP-4-dehydrorhamnose reductase